MVYRGGIASLPKAKSGGIEMHVTAESFEFEPTAGSRKWWEPLSIRFGDIEKVEIVDRQVSTGEALLGGLQSRQLNQANNIHIMYRDQDEKTQLLRLEMVTGVSVMGQARKCREFEDMLRVNGIPSRFRGSSAAASESPPPVDQEVPERMQAAEVAEQIRAVGALRDEGLLTAEEFESKKSELLKRL